MLLSCPTYIFLDSGCHLLSDTLDMDALGYYNDLTKVIRGWAVTVCQQCWVFVSWPEEGGPLDMNHNTLPETPENT